VKALTFGAAPFSLGLNGIIRYPFVFPKSAKEPE
jgi:hypothetical protein